MTDQKNTREDCITKNVKTIKETFIIGDNTIETEQRKLVKAEIKEYSNSHIDIMQDKDIFLAILEDQQTTDDNKTGLENPNEDQAVKLSDDSKFIIHNASKKIKRCAEDLENKFIKYSLTKNRFYGGYIKINGEEITNQEEIAEIIDSLESDIFNLLHSNINKLQYPTPDDIEEAKSSQVE